jgi:hypothetical protein
MWSEKDVLKCVLMGKFIDFDLFIFNTDKGKSGTVSIVYGLSTSSK